MKTLPSGPGSISTNRAIDPALPFAVVRTLTQSPARARRIVDPALGQARPADRERDRRELTRVDVLSTPLSP